MTANFSTNGPYSSTPNVVFNPALDNAAHATMLRTFRDNANLQLQSDQCA